MKLTAILTFDEYMIEHPISRGFFFFALGLCGLLYSYFNIKYSENRTKILKEEAKTDKSKYFNLGLIIDVKWHAIISILMGIGLIIYGIVLIIENIFYPPRCRASLSRVLHDKNKTTAEAVVSILLSDTEYE